MKAVLGFVIVILVAHVCSATSDCQLQNPTFQTDDFYVYNGICHWFSVNMAWSNYTGARTFCSRRGARLVTIKDSAKQRWLESLFTTNSLPRRNFWIGLDDLDEKNFKWSDGSAFDVANDYNNWYKPLKHHKLRDCALLHRVGKKWVLVSCRRRFRYICEIP
ncbi:snaclec A6-like [Branchiostoma floridae]|uniref:Snaclec A6-like n=1 Tax=Branchiostoma floridae TaxID=7739 RepID=A0A9J7LI57_BRAFL|nr:snaclec A6-like [Branchiostoma floridae]